MNIDSIKSAKLACQVLQIWYQSCEHCLNDRSCRADDGLPNKRGRVANETIGASESRRDVLNCIFHPSLFDPYWTTDTVT